MNILFNTETIDNYLNGNLDSNLLALFEEQINDNKDLVEQVFCQKIIKETIKQYYKIAQLQTIMSQIYSRHTDTQKRVYTTKQLTKQFKPCYYYEQELIAAPMRSSRYALKVIEPQKEANFDNELFFSFDVPTPIACNLIIENNEETIVEQYDIAAGSTNFTILLSNYLPGRYYWKLDVGDDLLIGSIFVQKNLMPERVDF